MMAEGDASTAARPSDQARSRAPPSSRALLALGQQADHFAAVGIRLR